MGVVVEVIEEIQAVEIVVEVQGAVLAIIEEVLAAVLTIFIEGVVGKYVVFSL
jgi:hypothetical protein